MIAFSVGKTQFEIVQGSALDQQVDILVNAANRKMRGGGGIDGAIHQLAGPGLLQELIARAPQGCHTGGVIPTGGYDSPFKHILHTPGPIWEGGDQGERMALAQCYHNTITFADRHCAHNNSVVYCSISTGIYRFPLDEAAEIALDFTSRYCSDDDTELNRVVFAMFKPEEYAAYEAAAKKLKFI